MRKAIALVLAGGRIHGYGPLTLNRAKAALPFAGFYRIVDFALSSLSHSGIERVGLVCQYLPASLIEHVAGGEPWGLRGFGRELRLMPPFVGLGKIEWFRGTADAIYQNLNFVNDWDPSYVIVCSAEHVFAMDFRDLLEFHEESKADLTIVETQLPPERLSKRFGYVISDGDRVTQFIEKPAQAPSDRISTGMYVFGKNVLIDQLERIGQGDECFNLAANVIPPMIEEFRVVRYPFTGYWHYMETIEDYWHANMSLLESPPPIDVLGWEVVTNLDDRDLARRPSAYIGPAADVRDSLISPGCRIEGTVHHSVLSPGVTVARDAVVTDSILMHDVQVESGARVHQVISDKDSLFGEDAEAGVERALDSDSPLRLTLVGKGYSFCGNAIPKWHPGPSFGPLPAGDSEAAE